MRCVVRMDVCVCVCARARARECVCVYVPNSTCVQSGFGYTGDDAFPSLIRRAENAL